MYKVPSPLVGEGKGEGDIDLFHTSVLATLLEKTHNFTLLLRASERSVVPQNAGLLAMTVHLIRLY